MEGFVLMLIALITLFFGCTVSYGKVKICNNSPVYPYDESMNMLLFSKKASEFAKKNISPTQKTTYNREESKCPSGGFSDIAEPNLRRTCPYHTVINYDPRRKPALVFEARCKCKACLSRFGTTRDMCKPVYYFRHVLMKDEARNCYNHSVQAFSVGCHCIGASDNTGINSRPLQ